MQNWIYVLKGIRLKHLNLKIRKPVGLTLNAYNHSLYYFLNYFYLNSSIFQVILDNYDNEKKVFAFNSESNY